MLVLRRAVISNCILTAVTDRGFQHPLECSGSGLDGFTADNSICVSNTLRRESSHHFRLALGWDILVGTRVLVARARLGATGRYWLAFGLGFRLKLGLGLGLGLRFTEVPPRPPNIYRT